MKLCMKHQRPKPFIFCANYDPGLTMTYSTILQLRLLHGENVTMMDFLEISASCDLECGQYGKLNE